MFGRVLTLHVRLEKRPELDRKFQQEVIPLLKRSAGLLEFLMLQDDVEVDKILLFCLWQTREDAERHHLADYAKVKAILEPYLTFPPAVHTYKVDTATPWWLPPPELKAEALAPRDPVQGRFVSWR